MRWGMVIDLKRCASCHTCTAACKAEHHTPPGVFWAKVVRVESGKYPTVTRQGLPLLCMNCREPECEKVCPTGATERRADGIVVVDSDKCVGCRYCSVACPYGARYFSHEWKDYFTGNSVPSSAYAEHSRRMWLEESDRGVVSKCNICADRVEENTNPACVDACPCEARIFGDLEDPESEVSQLIKKRRGRQLHPEYDTDASVYYLPAR